MLFPFRYCQIAEMDAFRECLNTVLVLVSPDRQNGCLSQHWNAKIQIAKMDARTQMLEYGTRIENAAAWRCYVHKINPKFHNFYNWGWWVSTEM
jgi:hypothetical protein